MQNDDAIRLQYMLDAVNEAMAFSEGRVRENLDGNRMLVLVIVKELEIIGEAAYQISERTKSQTPEIP